MIRRLLLAIVLTLSPCSAWAGWSAPTPLASTNGTTSATSQTLTGITATSGTFLAVALSASMSTTVTGEVTTDSAGNTWTTQCKLNTTPNGMGCIAYSILTNALSGGTITFTRTGSGNLLTYAATAASFTGNKASSPEDTAVFATAVGNTVSPSVTGNTATQAGDLLIAVFNAKVATTLSYTEDAGHGWLNIYNINNGAGTSALGMAYRTNGSTPGIKHNPLLSPSVTWTELEIGFSPLTALGSAGALLMTGVGQ